MEWVGLGYVALLVPASLFAGSLCKIARLSGQNVENDRREVLIWGSLPTPSETTTRDKERPEHRPTSHGLTPLS